MINEKLRPSRRHRLRGAAIPSIGALALAVTACTSSTDDDAPTPVTLDDPSSTIPGGPGDDDGEDANTTAITTAITSDDDDNGDDDSDDTGDRDDVDDTDDDG
ncbi:MAG: hypothetical protein ACRDZ2_05380, partial [Ilumatobacteraceae bacterium]